MKGADEREKSRGAATGHEDGGIHRSLPGLENGLEHFEIRFMHRAMLREERLVLELLRLGDARRAVFEVAQVFEKSRNVDELLPPFDKRAYVGSYAGNGVFRVHGSSAL